MDWQGTTESEGTQASKAKAYEAPKVQRVSLRPEEAVLGHCKVAGSAGAVSASCRPVTGPCRTPGS